MIEKPESTQNIFEYTSFALLNNASKKAIEDLYAQYKQGAQYSFDIYHLFKSRKSLAASLGFFSEALDNTREAVFPYLKDTQKERYKEQLLFTFYVLSAQYALDDAEHRSQSLARLSAQIKRCAELIEQLEGKTEYVYNKEDELSRRMVSTIDHFKYLGIDIGFDIARTMVDVVSVDQWSHTGQTYTIRAVMNAVNRRRMYWIWGGNLLNTMIGTFVADDFLYKAQTLDAIAVPSMVGGYLSWLLYFARFGMNLGLLLKHTIKGPWMSKAESSIPWTERFKTQWEFRKFTLLNDSIWGVANLVSFFWLVGNGFLGYAGNVLCAALLLMDTCLSILAYHEAMTEYNKQMQYFTSEKENLTALIKTSPTEQLTQQLEILKRAEKKYIFEWKYKKYSLINDLAYAALLFGSFTLMCCFLCPPAGMAVAAATIFGVVGAVLCFAVTLAYASSNVLLERAKEHALQEDNRMEARCLLNLFKTEKDDQIKKQHYLSIQGLMAKTEAQREQIAYLKKKLIHTVVVDALLPALIFVSFMFTPLALGLPVVFAGIALAFLMHYLMGQKPKTQALEFDEQEYQKFEQDPKLEFFSENKLPPAENKGFFGSKSKSEPSEAGETELPCLVSK